MNIAPMIAANVAAQNAVRCAQMAAVNAARAAKVEDEYEVGDEELEGDTLSIDGPTFAAICAVAVFGLFFMALILFS